jgi:hypothetical protein
VEERRLFNFRFPSEKSVFFSFIHILKKICVQIPEFCQEALNKFIVVVLLYFPVMYTTTERSEIKADLLLRNTRILTSNKTTEVK